MFKIAQKYNTDDTEVIAGVREVGIYYNIT